MNLIYIATLVAVCSAAKLDRTYLPPESSKTAGGSADLLTPHFRDSFEPGRNGLPKGAEENEFDGVVVEAVASGTRQSRPGESGLGGSRPSYGSILSKVGEAAFRIKEQQRPDEDTQGIAAGQSDSQTLQSFQQGASSDFNRPRPAVDQPGSQILQSFNEGGSSNFNRPRPAIDQSDSPQSFHQGALSEFNKPHPVDDQSNSQTFNNFHQEASSHFTRPHSTADRPHLQKPHTFNQGASSDYNRERPQSALDRISNTVRIQNNIGTQAYNYGYETENGITAEERGVSINGVQAEGGFSYTGDDGKFYKITYTAGEGGYQPVGDHLPTPHPIPDEILKSLEQNAKEEAGGSEDDGSYDAAKYNAEDDYTKSDSSNSRQPAFGKKPESDVDVSGTFINQNNRPYESFSNNNHQEPTSIHRFSEQFSSIGNNLTSTQDEAGSNDNVPTSYYDQHDSDTTKFSPPQNAQGGVDATLMHFGLTENNVQFNKQDNEFGSDDFSRPINFGAAKFTQPSRNRFNNKQPNAPTSNYFTQNQGIGMKSDIKPSTQGELSPQRESPAISENSNFLEKDGNNINQQNVGSHEDSQIKAKSNKLMNNVEFHRNSNVPERQSSTLQSIPSTLTPSLELSTPFESFSNYNQDVNVNFQSQNQRGTSRPTQQPFSSVVTPDSQSNIATYSGFVTSNANVNSHLHNYHLQQDSNFSQKLPSEETQNLNFNSINNPKKDQSYYYNKPSITFNPYSRPTTPTFALNRNENTFISSFPTKYPSAPTVATVFPSLFPGRNMYSQNTNIPQVSSFIPQNNVFGATTKYPQPPSLGHIIPSPTSPTLHNGEKIFDQHTGITQASVSPFPSIAPSKYNNDYNSQQTETTAQNFPSNSQANEFRQETNAKPESVDGLAQNIPNFAMVDAQIKPSQQYNGEVYEYKKPTETLATPTESDESIQHHDFSQFGQKLQPSKTQKNFDQINKSNEYNNNQRYPASQGSLSSTGNKPLTEFQNTQPQLSLQMTSDANNQEFDSNDIRNRQPLGPASDTQSTNNLQPTQISQFLSDAFGNAQTTANYDGPFAFSSRIRPCCQGPRRTSMAKTSDLIAGNDFRNSASIGHRNKNLRPGFEGAKPFSTQSTGLQNDLQNAQTTSQSFFSAKEEEFDGARQPPRFDEASGYHY